MTETVARVAYLEGAGQLTFREETLPPPGPTQLSCRTLASVISPGTELAAWKGLPPLRPGPVYPRLVGYCNVAEVIAVGRDVIHVSPGDRILSYASHRTHFLLDETDVLLTLDASLDPAIAATAYLFHLGYNAVLRAGVRPGSRVLVIGLGALGLGSVAMADIAGAEVRAVSDQAASASIARDFGAEEVLGREGSARAKNGWGSGADVVISTTSSWTDWRLALEASGRMGTIAVLGFPGRGEPRPDFNPLDSQYLYDKQLRVEAVGASPEREDPRGFLRFNERANLSYIVDLIATGRLRPDAIVSRRFPAAKLADAYNLLASREEAAVTFALDWS